MLEADVFEVEKAEREKREKPRKGMALLDLTEGTWFLVEEVREFHFSKDSRWLAYLRHPPEKTEQGPEGGAEEETQSREGPSEQGAEKEGQEVQWSSLLLRSLAAGQEVEIAEVSSFAFDPQSRFLVYVAKNGEEGEQLVSRGLNGGGEGKENVILTAHSRVGELRWSKEGKYLALLSKEERGAQADLWVWDGLGGGCRRLGPTPEGWRAPFTNKLKWSEDERRLFLGLKRPAAIGKQQKEDEESKTDGEDLLSRQVLLERSEVDIWHWNDPRIIPHQKKAWKKLQEHTYMGVCRIAEPDRIVPLADEEMPDINPSENPSVVLGRSDIPYLKQITWEGRFHDSYLVSLVDGSRTKIAGRLISEAHLSPGGGFVAFYQDGNWHLYNREENQSRNLTQDLGLPFSNEDHDYPSQVPGYGMAGWTEGDRALLIYDKFDVWQFPTQGGSPFRITDGKGRHTKTQFRVVKTDPDQRFFGPNEMLLLRSFNEHDKSYGFYSATVGRPGVRVLLNGEKKFDFLKKAEKVDKLIFTRQDYDEFPDIWVTDSRFQKPRRLTNLNPQLGEFAWGQSELVEWRSLDGIPLQGVLIKPGNYEPGKRCPVLVYFYRFFSQRLHEFNQPVVNHRPCFPLYASQGYALFLPDIRFEIGRPGFSATKCLVPGVQKLIDMGIADPEAIGLHGHSWSGYQTAFIVTQTDMFAAAIAGAPVSNMTSAYGGIRWNTGLARQFQYEKTQSRIGGSLWEFPERYIENSPLFFADRISTPLLIMFGDEDGAVPWYQGIELYLAMRRLGKEAIFLQYRGEPHHLKKYPNKLDYAVRMKQYLDHYLKGVEAPEWILSGKPYEGK